MSWNIRRVKKYIPLSLIESGDLIRLDEWQDYVDCDPDLMWEEDSPIAKDYRNAGKQWIDEENYRRQAYYDFNHNQNWAGLRFGYFKGTISANTERQTLKRVEKMWQVAEALNGYLFKNGTRFTEKKLETLREKYDKTGKQAPSDDNQEV